MKQWAWFSLFFLFSCGSQHSCAPNFKDLKINYPHVIYHGKKLPSEIILKKTQPANWAPLTQISKKLQGAIIVSEDWAFYEHHGYDEKQIKEAVQKSIEGKKLIRGASTITQQVVKNIYLSKEKSLVRKVRELWMAIKVEKILGKSRILELYLNIAELGEGIFGVGQASQFYFHKNPSELTAKEGAFLAMLLPSPKKYAVSFRRGELTIYARKIIRSILDKMVMAQFLTVAERDLEWSTPLNFEKKIDASVPDATLLNSDDDEVDSLE